MLEILDEFIETKERNELEALKKNGQKIQDDPTDDEIEISRNLGQLFALFNAFDNFTSGGTIAGSQSSTIDSITQLDIRFDQKNSKEKAVLWDATKSFTLPSLPGETQFFYLKLTEGFKMNLLFDSINSKKSIILAIVAIVFAAVSIGLFIAKLASPDFKDKLKKWFKELGISLGISLIVLGIIDIALGTAELITGIVSGNPVSIGSSLISFTAGIIDIVTGSLLLYVSLNALKKPLKL